MENKKSLSFINHPNEKGRRNFLSGLIFWILAFLTPFSFKKESEIMGLQRVHAGMVKDNDGNTVSQKLEEINKQLVDIENQQKRVIPDFKGNYPILPRKTEGIGSLSLRPHPNAKNPVLTATSVTDATASFVADPFIVYENGMYYMFFEAFVGTLGKIAVATSRDGVKWEYKQIVLSDNVIHYAYPHVFKIDGVWYMLPDMGGYTSGLKLYFATEFPYTWTLDTNLFTTGKHIDATQMYWNDKWYMFTYNSDTQTVNLYYADSFKSTSWTLHPSSPVFTGLNLRHGGRPLIYDNTIDMFVQDGRSGVYGEKLWVYRIYELTPTTFQYSVMEKPVLRAQKNGAWNSQAMHHTDICLSQGNSLPIVAVDGNVEGVQDKWSIGIYTVGNPLPEKFQAYPSADLSVDGGEWRSFLLNTAENSGIGTYNFATGTFTAVETGYFNIGLNVVWNVTNPSGLRFQTNMRMKINNVETITSPHAISVAKRQTVKFSDIVWLNVGDTVSFDVYHDSTITPQSIQGLKVNTWATIWKM